MIDIPTWNALTLHVSYVRMAACRITTAMHYLGSILYGYYCPVTRAVLFVDLVASVNMSEGCTKDIKLLNMKVRVIAAHYNYINSTFYG